VFFVLTLLRQAPLAQKLFLFLPSGHLRRSVAEQLHYNA